MTADVAYDPEAKPDGFRVEDNAKLLAEYADRSDVHATIHNHVNSAAGQSGTDFNDEKGLPGPHITIGYLNQRKLSFHARLSTIVNGNHRFIQLRPSDVIGFQMPGGGIKKETLEELENAWLTFDSSDDEIPEEWQDRFQLQEKKIITYNGFPRQTDQKPQNGSQRNAPEENETLEEFVVSQKDRLTKWPYGFLEGIPLDDPQAFKAACNSMSLVQIHAMLGICYSLGPNADYNDVLDELRKRRDKTSATAIN